MRIDSQNTVLTLDESPAARDRLLRALGSRLCEGTARELRGVAIEALADDARVSRATAYRYFGSRAQLPRQSALLLLERWAAERPARSSVPALATASAMIAGTLAAWSLRVNRTELVRSSWHGADAESIRKCFRAVIGAQLAPLVGAGQVDGQLRDDLAPSELVAWLVEQGQVLVQLDLGEEGVGSWLWRFVLPAIRRPGPSSAAKTLLETCLSELQASLTGLDELARRGSELSSRDR